MEHKLQLTARGQAVCELMLDQGLSLEAACSRVQCQLEALRGTVERIMNDRPWQEIPRAMQLALEGVSRHVQSAYLEEEPTPRYFASSPALADGKNDGCAKVPLTRQP